MTTATVSPTVVKSTTSTSKAPLLTDPSQQDIPIFLRKTYHMVDTCDPSVACWSEDGETFVVKDPIKFEKQIIPQFFKHSKFSSFVRQLNFYSFRKIKYVDTIRLDPKLEAETANYWRFRHEKFQRGKPELLGEIKRMNGQKQTKGESPGPATTTTLSAPPAPVLSQVVEKENSALKSEVSNLKQRIEAMTKNIDELTSMVQKVTLATCPPDEDKMNDNHKRAKVIEAVQPDEPVSASPSATAALVEDATPDMAPSEVTTSMELDPFPLPPSMPSPMANMDRTTTSTSDLTDEGFVDQLFTAFTTEDFVDFDENSATLADAMEDETTTKQQQQQQQNNNRPRPELMNRLSDALSALPRDIQELIVDRLIQAITSPKEIQDQISKVKDNKKEEQALQVAPTKDPKQIANLQLAAATLAALLSQCGGETKQLKDSHNKTLLIPVHA